MTYQEWLTTCKEWKPTDSDIPQYILDTDCEFITAYEFKAGFFLEIAPNHYWTIVIQDEFDTGSFDIMTQWLWDNWSRDEVNS